MTLDKILDLLVKTHWEEAKSAEQNKEVILSDWRSMAK
jgi:hypothetical protein